MLGLLSVTTLGSVFPEWISSALSASVGGYERLQRMTRCCPKELLLAGCRDSSCGIPWAIGASAL